MASNQLRLWFSTFAYMLVRDLRADALVGLRHRMIQHIKTAKPPLDKRASRQRR